MKQPSTRPGTDSNTTVAGTRLRRLALPVLLGVLTCIALSSADVARAGERSSKAGPTGSRAEAQIELGRRLFFEPMASPSGKRSCASCHDPEHGFSDPKRVSVDDFGMTRRHSQAILDTRHNPTSHWDGEFNNVEELVEARLTATPLTGGYGRGGPTTPFTPSSVMSAADSEEAKAQRLAMKEMMKAAFQEMRRQAGAQSDDPDATTLQKLQAHLGTHFLGVSGVANKEAVAKKLEASGRYAEAFRTAFGSETIQLARIGKALDAYCKSIVSTEAPIDRHRAGDGEALSASAHRGLALFEGRAGCAECHVSNAEHARFTDYEFHNTGVAWDDFKKGHFSGSQPQLAAMLENPAVKKQLEKHLGKSDSPLAELLSDMGHGAVSKTKDDRRAFKTPTLRDVAKRGPYMHNGRFESLEAVVRYYAAGCGDDAEKDARLKGFEASDQDVADLVAFLQSLTGDERPGLAKHAWSRRASATRLRFVDHEGKPLTGMLVGVQPTGDAIPTSRKGAPGREVETDEDGWIRYVPPPTTHTRLILSEALIPVGGDFVPDTCDEATVQLPVKGRMKLVLIFAEGQESPGIVQMHHTPQGIMLGNGFATFTKRNFVIGSKSDGSEPSPKAKVLSMQGLLAAPVEPTRFLRTSLKTIEGRQIATYEGWVRSDVDANATLVVPDEGSQDKDLYRRPIVLKEGSVAKLALAK